MLVRLVDLGAGLAGLDKLTDIPVHGGPPEGTLEQLKDADWTGIPGER